MKKLILFPLLGIVSMDMARATPVAATVITISSPKMGEAPAVNRLAAAPSPYYRMSWRTVTENGAAVNYLTTFAFAKTQYFTADSIFAATTYAEMQAEALTLGITNLPVDPNAGP